MKKPLKEIIIDPVIYKAVQRMIDEDQTKELMKRFDAISARIEVHKKRLEEYLQKSYAEPYY